jgi:hypothetical protein
VFQRPPRELELLGNDGRRVTVIASAIPRSGNGLMETRAMGPVVIESENSGFWNMGGNLDKERDMVRGTPSLGRHDRTRKNGVPREVDESTVKPFQSRSISFVGPGESSVHICKVDAKRVTQKKDQWGNGFMLPTLGLYI